MRQRSGYKAFRRSGFRIGPMSGFVFEVLFHEAARIKERIEVHAGAHAHGFEHEDQIVGQKTQARANFLTLPMPNVAKSSKIADEPASGTLLD